MVFLRVFSTVEEEWISFLTKPTMDAYVSCFLLFGLNINCCYQP
jgi:hypothetical protein